MISELLTVNLIVKVLFRVELGKVNSLLVPSADDDHFSLSCKDFDTLGVFDSISRTDNGSI